MPSMMTHYLFAERVFNVLQKSLSEISFKREYFYWGAHGGSIFGTSGLMRNDSPSLSPVRNALMQHHICEILELFNEFAKLYPTMQEAVTSYALGYICHYKLNSAAHPFINAQIKNYRTQHFSRYKNASLHNIIEHQLDSYMIWRECGIYPTKMHFYEVLPPVESVSNVIANLYKFLLHRLYGLDIESEQMVFVLEEYYDYQKYLDRQKGARLYLTKAAGIIKGNEQDILCSITPKIMSDDFDYNNAAHARWINPYDKSETERTDSFHEIFDGSVSSAVKLCAGYLIFSRMGGGMCKFTDCADELTGIKNDTPYPAERLMTELKRANGK